MIARITGTVVGGKRVGRTLGFPTANIQPDRAYELPENGVYAARISVPGEREMFPCVLNQGDHPTLPEGGRTIEAYILDFDRDIYGAQVAVEYVRFLRPERKFGSIDALKERILRDAEETRREFCRLREADAGIAADPGGSRSVGGAIAPMTREFAQTIAQWAYEGDYALYSFSGSAEDIRELLNGDYFAAVGASGEPEGYFCFGASARIPTVEEGVYPDGALDVGLGMRPDLCGRGGGAAFVRSGLAFAQIAFGAARFRLTVAAFNIRAIRAYEKAGFRRIRAVAHRATGMEFLVMLCEASHGPIGTD